MSLFRLKAKLRMASMMAGKSHPDGKFYMTCWRDGTRMESKDEGKSFYCPNCGKRYEGGNEGTQPNLT